MCKYFLFFISTFSFLISNQVTHDYNSAITSFTKTADQGRINIEIVNSNMDYKDAYIGDSKYGFNQLTNISGINYFGYDMNTIFDKAGVSLINNEYVLDNFSIKYNTVGFNTSYHGYNGMGYYASYEMGKMEFPHSNETQTSWSPSTTSVTLGIYALWNEIYSTSSPAMVDGRQYTFPTTRILTGVYANRYRDLFDTYSSVVYLRIAMDFIISEKLIMSNKLDYELSDDNNVFMSLFASKFMYDLNDKVSIAGSLQFEQDNEGDHLLNLLLEGGYQFNDIEYGYTKFNLKLSPYFKSNAGGKNSIYSAQEFGIKINLLFN